MEVIITKAQFRKYRQLQESGVINMLDVNNGTRLTGLSVEAYTEIIRNYKRYYEQYEEK